MTVDSEKKQISLYVTVNVFEYPRLFKALNEIENKQVRSRFFKNLAEKELQNNNGDEGKEVGQVISKTNVVEQMQKVKQNEIKAETEEQVKMTGKFDSDQNLTSEGLNFSKTGFELS